MQNINITLGICCLLTLFLCGNLLFLVGFFPASYSKVETEEQAYAGRPTDLDGIRIEPPKKSYDGIILMLIDALRVDFADNKNMPIAYEAACEKLKLHVDIPTVTMPRLKSITTGTLSNFIDIALNVGHTEQLDDSILHRLKQRGDIISFAGDRTWVQLFPSEFTRKVPNMDSFFVNEFYEGDRNVTDTLTNELEKVDWTLLILHYLGLDHIGHVEGNESIKIKAKLEEMDAAVDKILKAKNFDNYLLLLTGDHGMRDGGGHGGNTPEELFVPLYTFKTNCTKSVSSTKYYNQIDMTPTLAILFSIDIPNPSIGCLIPEMLKELSLEDQLYAHHYNAWHLMNQARIKFGRKYVKKTDYFKWFEQGKSIHQQFLVWKRNEAITSHVLYQNAILDYMRASREVSSQLSESLVKFDYGFITVGIALTVSTTLYLLLSIMYMDMKSQLQLVGIKTTQYICSLMLAIVLNTGSHYMHYIATSSIMRSSLLVLPISVSIYLTIDIVRVATNLLLQYTRNLHSSIPFPVPLWASLLLQAVTLGSSSFIEREHLTWYYLGNSLLIVTLVNTFHKRVLSANTGFDSNYLFMIAPQCIWQFRKYITVFVLLTMMRGLDNVTGITTFSLIVSLLLLFDKLRTMKSIAHLVICFIATLLIYCFRGLQQSVSFFPPALYTNNLIKLVLILFWICIGLIAIVGYKHAFNKQSIISDKQDIIAQLLQTNLTCSLLIAALLHKPQNVILLPAMLIVLKETYTLCDMYCTTQRKHSYRLVHIYKTVLTIFIAKMFHFYQGNSNSLSTIDLNPGYIGQSSYNPIIVGVLVTINTYCAEIHSFLYLIVHTICMDRSDAERGAGGSGGGGGIIKFQSQFNTAATALVMPLYTALTVLPVAFYLCLCIGFRYHLFIYSVFSPKALYAVYSVVVFYFNLLITSLYFKICKNEI